MKVALALLAAIAAACLFWIAVVSLALAPDPPVFSPVAVAPEAPAVEVVPEHVEYFRSEERQKRIDAMRDELRAMEAKNEKLIAQACKAGHLDKEYCD